MASQQFPPRNSEDFMRRATTQQTQYNTVSDQKELDPMVRLATGLKLDQQQSVRSKTHGIPTWEHPGNVAIGSNDVLGQTSSRHFPPNPYRPPQTAGPLRPLEETGTVIDHHTRLSMHIQTPKRMLVSFSSGRSSCCPSIGSLTVDASEIPDYMSVVTPTASSFDDCNSATVTVKRGNHSNEAVSPDRQMNDRILGQPRSFDRSPRKHVRPSTSRLSVLCETTPSSSFDYDTLALNPFGVEHVATATPQPVSLDSDIFCQMRGLSFRDPPPNVDLETMTAEKKRKKAKTKTKGTHSFSPFFSRARKLVPSNQQKVKSTVVPVKMNPTARQLEPTISNGDDAVEYLWNSHFDKPHTAQPQIEPLVPRPQEMYTSDELVDCWFEQKIFAHPATKAVASVTKGDIVILGNKTVPVKTSSFLPLALIDHDDAKTGKSSSFDGDVDNCSATATTISSSTLKSDHAKPLNDADDSRRSLCEQTATVDYVNKSDTSLFKLFAAYIENSQRNTDGSLHLSDSHCNLDSSTLFEI